MYRFLLAMMFMVLILETPAFAQDQDDEPLPPPRRSAAPKIGGGAGFIQHYLFLDMDPINKMLVSANAAPFDGNGLVMLGGQGYGYIMLLPNFRLGGQGASGTRTSRSLQGNTRRTVELSVGYGGVTMDYVIPIRPRVDVALGMVLGSGGMSMKITRDNGAGKDWNQIWKDFGGQDSVYNYSSTLEGSFFVYQPSVNVEVAVLRWLGLRVGASYLGMAGGNWKADDQFDIIGVPDNISGKGWMINGGIFLGTFLF
jgi:hypothetical protein